MESLGYEVNTQTSEVHCKVFEDNSGAVEIARFHKFRPRTKHLNNRLFHFRGYVDKGWISIHPIKTTEQSADMLTKAQKENQWMVRQNQVTRERECSNNSVERTDA